MRIVIMGCGRTGAYLAKTLAGEGHQVTVIDRTSAAFKRLGDDFTGELVMGTGIDEDVLHRAGIEHADVFVAVTDGDNTNVMAAQVARQIFGVRRVICRVYDPLREEIYRNLGLETICPTLLGASRIQEILSQ
ncbi:MAG TPA: TrkA family potassium uptake protein [Anaerolineae bacterium]|nr:TrkA family potassium uptake protein [Anaerolineae bacterium]HPL29762.1 TrkA family potassium uptake protein [Anaerolineae bacterium]